jgi:Fur family peroxide stress response transcriptional regulator
MIPEPNGHDADDIRQRLTGNGLRLTAQRRQVYAVLLERRDHPTAEEVFLRAKQTMPDISFATVYNCLDTLVQCGLARQVNVDASARRFCPNMREHGHFYCEGCDQIYDIEAEDMMAGGGLTLPRGFQMTRVEWCVRGYCAGCAQTKETRRKG